MLLYYINNSKVPTEMLLYYINNSKVPTEMLFIFIYFIYITIIQSTLRNGLI
jgi:hypothetical protein